MNGRIFPIYFIFLVMGFGDLIGPLVSLVGQKLALTRFEASLIAFAGFIMFGSLSIPAGIFQEKYGKKATVTIGLLLVLAGLVLPLSGLNLFALFLLAVALLGAGATVLQVAGSPLLHEVSMPGSFARNLSFGQFIKGIGTLSSPVIPWLAFRYFKGKWEIVFVIFGLCVLVTIGVFLYSTRKTPVISAGNTSASVKDIFSLLKRKQVSLMVLGIFIYVGAEVCLATTLPALLKRGGYTDSGTGMAGLGIFFLSIMSGRFLGSIILSWISPARFFLFSCLASILGLAILVFTQGIYSFAGAILTGLGFSNVFPLVFSIAIEQRPSRAAELSGLMVTAIAGGALIPPIMGYMGDTYSLPLSMAIPFICFLYLLYLSVYCTKVETTGVGR